MTFGTVPGQPLRVLARPAPAARRRTVRPAAALTGVAILAALLNAVLILGDGRAMVRGIVARAFLHGAGVVPGGPVFDRTVEAAYATLEARAYFWIVLGVAGLVLLPAVHGGHVGARVALRVLIPLYVLLALRDLTDTVPTMCRLLDGVVVAISCAALALLWVGPNNTLGRYRRTGRHR